MNWKQVANWNALACNEQVLLSGGVFENRPPGANAWLFLKIEDNNKMWVWKTVSRNNCWQRVTAEAYNVTPHLQQYPCYKPVRSLKTVTNNGRAYCHLQNTGLNDKAKQLQKPNTVCFKWIHCCNVPHTPATKVQPLCHTKKAAKNICPALDVTILRLYKKNVNHHTVPRKL